MKVTLEKAEKNTVVMEITVPATELDTAYEKAAKKVAKEVNIPGFRKGKVPKNILEKYVGETVLLEEACLLYTSEILTLGL